MALGILAEGGFRQFEEFLEAAPGITRRAARLALNQTVERKGVRMVRDLMREQVAFPRGYLEQDDRLGVTQRATDANLQAAITGRSRPTSLARFATSGSSGVRQAPVRVRVNPGRSALVDRAFLIRLRGSVDAYNIGLAVRLKPGERLENKNVMAQSFGKGSGLYLLYGPSVDQVFRDVAPEVAPLILDAASDEFLRQFTRLAG